MLPRPSSEAEYPNRRNAIGGCEALTLWQGNAQSLCHAGQLNTRTRREARKRHELYIGAVGSGVWGATVWGPRCTRPIIAVIVVLV